MSQADEVKAYKKCSSFPGHPFSAALFHFHDWSQVFVRNSRKLTSLCMSLVQCLVRAGRHLATRPGSCDKCARLSANQRRAPTWAAPKTAIFDRGNHCRETLTITIGRQ